MTTDVNQAVKAAIDQALTTWIEDLAAYIQAEVVSLKAGAALDLAKENKGG